MKYLKYLFLSILLVSFATGAYALPLDNGPFYANYNNLEQIIAGDDNNNDGIPDNWNTTGEEDNWGILRMTQYDLGTLDSSGTIQAGTSPYTWEEGDYDKELTGIFYDIDITESSNLTPGLFSMNAIGGKMDIYLNDYGTIGWDTVEASGRTDTDQFTDITDGELWLSLEFVPYAHIGSEENYTVYGSSNGSIPPTGTTSYYLSVTGGSAQEYFDTDYYSVDQWNSTTSSYDTVTADFLGKNSFSEMQDRGWTNGSEDPVTGWATPEPTTMLLFGFGLLGLAGVSRKRFQA